MRGLGLVLEGRRRCLFRCLLSNLSLLLGCLRIGGSEEAELCEKQGGGRKGGQKHLPLKLVFFISDFLVFSSALPVSMLIIAV